MVKYAFVLGRNPELSIAELGAFFGKITVAPHRAAAFFEGNLPFPPQDFLNRLGGCVEILEIFEKEIPVHALESALVDFLKKKTGKILFALNLIPEKKSRLLKFLLPRIKKSLQQASMSAAFLNKNFANVSPVAAVKQKLVERGTNISIIEEKVAPFGRVNEVASLRLGLGKVSLGYSVAMQDFESYSKRDYGKPFRDPQSGMLPPKLAQIMINLAVGANVIASEAKQSSTILDPFCGTGTILMEALLMGYSVIGSDADHRMVEGAQKNIDWLRQIFPSRVRAHIHAQLFQKDAMALPNVMLSLSKHEGANQSSSLALAVVTEPYLGPPLSSFPAEKFLGKLMKELEDLYVGFFKNLAKWIPKKTPIVFIFPYWKKRDIPPVRLSEPLVAKIESLGYSKTTFVPLQKTSLFYDRPDSVVGREVVRFIKK